MTSFIAIWIIASFVTVFILARAIEGVK